MPQTIEQILAELVAVEDRRYARANSCGDDVVSKEEKDLILRDLLRARLALAERQAAKE